MTNILLYFVFLKEILTNGYPYNMINDDDIKTNYVTLIIRIFFFLSPFKSHNKK